jgi:hypothetical protein
VLNTVGGVGFVSIFPTSPALTSPAALKPGLFNPVPRGHSQLQDSSVTDKPQPSPAMKRFTELVRERRTRLHRKERNDPGAVFEVANLRQVAEQVSLELAAGVAHDPENVAGLQRYADEIAAAISRKVADAKPKRFRGLGR